MTNLPRRLLAVVLVSLMVAAAATGGGMAATPSIDEETSNTAYESEIQTDTVLSDFEANSSNESTVVLEGDNSTSPTIEISANGSDTVVYENDSMDNQTADSWGTTWNGTLSHDELHDLERGINENVTVDLVAHDGNESNSTETQFYVNTTNAYTVQNLDDNDTDEEDVLETFDESNSLTKITSFDLHTLQFTELDIEDRAVDGDETDVVLVFSNDTVADDGSSAVPDGVADEDAMFRMTLLVSADDGPTQPIRVYHEDIPDSVDEDDDTYAIYKDGGIGGEDGVEINLGEEYEDAEEFSVTGTLNAGRVAALQHAVATHDLWKGTVGGLTSAISVDGLLAGGVPALVVGATAARRRRAAR